MIKVDYDRASFEEDLLEQGYKNIGHGSYAEVYRHPNKNTVLKIFDRDEAYLAFVRRIRRLKNPYFPRINRIKHYKFDYYETWTTVELEYLKSLDELPFHIRLDTLSKYSDYAITPCSDCNADGIDFNELVNSFNFQKSKDRKLNKAIDILQNLSFDYDLDLHGANIMLRKEKNNYRLVFTDPFWDGIC